MPSLFRYFVIGGAVLFCLLSLVNSVLQPSGPNPSVPASMRKAVMKQDPQASSLEHLPTGEQKAVAKGDALAAPVEPLVQFTPPADPVTPAQAEPVQVSGPAALTTARPTEAAARAARPARKKMQAERARKQRLARERARALEQAASRHQGPYFGYASQPTFGPFGGWGQP